MDLIDGFGLSFMLESQAEVTRIMFIVRKSGNKDGLIHGRIVLCTIVGVTTNGDGLIHHVFVHPVSHVYSIRGFILARGLPIPIVS